MNRIDELVKIINNANYEYYVLDNPSLSDQEYDDYFKELIDLEKKYPNYIRDDSPTNSVGMSVLLDSKKIKHSVPMLSLSDVRSFNDVKNFDKCVGSKEYVCELKIDGISVSLVYKNGVLISASTRGNGIIGEDILDSVKMIKDISHVLSIPISCEVRGEIYMDKSSFVECNKWRLDHGLSMFSSARNAASGCVRNSDKILTKWLFSYIYTLVNANDFSIHRHDDALCFIKDLGFNVNEHNKYVNNINGVIDYISNCCDIRDNLLYDIDGVVVKVNDLKEQNFLGNTNRYPRWAIAYKFQSASAYTKINDIVLTVGRTGKVTPIAIFEPVTLLGFCVKRATLHCYSYVKNNDIRIGDIARIVLSGDVIPRVDSCLYDRRIGNEEVFSFSSCPICLSNLIKKNNDYYCINNECPAKKINSLVHFASSNAMNLVGLGDEIIEDFYNCGFLRDISDFYGLKNFYNQIIDLGFDEKRLDFIMSGIENSKKNSLEKFIYGLGIKRVGIRNASILAEKFKSIDNLINASIFDIANIHDIGNVIARNVYYYFRDDNNINLIDKFISYGVNMKYSDDLILKNDVFYGKNFVLTGSFDFSRSFISDIIISFGGNIMFSISSNTDVLVVGKDPGLKYNKACELGVEIWDGDKFFKMVKFVNH